MTVEAVASHITARLLQDVDTIRVLGRLQGAVITLPDALQILRSTLDNMITSATTPEVVQ